MSTVEYLLADIGGTHARIAAYDGDKIGVPIVLKIVDFDCPVDLFQHAVEKLNVTKPRLAIASTGHEESPDVWHAANNSFWTLDKKKFEKSDVPITFWANDFYVTAYGALALGHDDLENLVSGESRPYAAKMIGGPGTGMGLAYADYIEELKSYRVRETFGGWFSVSAVTEEQILCLRTVRSLKNMEFQKTLSYEDVCAGRGLPYLYEAVCKIHGQEYNAEIGESLLTHTNAPLFNETLRLFHEFLGLFLNTAVIAGHAWGGIYLDGGVIQKVCEKGLFDVKALTSTLHANPQPEGQKEMIVHEALLNVPVKRIDTDYVALTGLKVILEHEVKK